MNELPRRVCFTAYRGNMACGGQGVYLWYLARELTRLGIEVDVVVGPPYPDPMPFARRVQHLPNQEHWARWFTGDHAGMLPAGAPLQALRPLNLYEMGASRLGFLPEPFAFSLRALGALAQRLRAGERWDIVHDVQCLGYGLLGLQAMGMPVVSTVHHPLTVDRRASFLRDESWRDLLGSMQFYPIGMQAFVARRIDRIFTSSEESARTIAADFRVRPGRIRNVRNGIDTDLFSPDERVPRHAAELLCVGRASDPNKGIKTLVRALAYLPKELRLTLVDSPGASTQISKWAREAGVEGRIDISGRVDVEDLVALYRRSTITVMPSRYEGFGLPAVEAMACGTPVVACRAGALPEVMRLTGGGLLVERDDPEALARGIRTLYENPALRQSLGKEAREQVDANLSWRHVARQTAEGYAEVLAERSGRPTSTMTSERLGY